MITDQLKPSNYAEMEDRLSVDVYGIPGRAELFKRNMYTVWLRSWRGSTIPAFEQIRWTETVPHCEDYVLFKGVVDW